MTAVLGPMLALCLGIVMIWLSVIEQNKGARGLWWAFLGGGGVLISLLALSNIWLWVEGTR